MLNVNNKGPSCWLGNGFCMAPVQKHFVILSKHQLLCPSLVPIWMTAFAHWGVWGLLFWLNLFLPSSRWCLSIDLSPLHRECTSGASDQRPDWCPCSFRSCLSTEVACILCCKKPLRNRRQDTRPWRSHLTSASLSFPTCKMEGSDQLRSHPTLNQGKVEWVLDLCNMTALS